LLLVKSMSIYESCKGDRLGGNIKVMTKRFTVIFCLPTDYYIQSVVFTLRISSFVNQSRGSKPSIGLVGMVEFHLF